jgi:short-subunit dehydrogenase
MKKAIIIIGMGPGLGLGMAIKFGNEGYAVGMISRNEEKLKKYKAQLTEKGIASEFATSDVGDTAKLLAALGKLSDTFGRIDVLHYNAVDYRVKHILQETSADLTNGFRLSVGNVVEAVKNTLPMLKQTKGAVLLTGGGTSDHPNPDFCTISLAKAGIKSLAYQLNEALSAEQVYVGSLNVHGFISESSAKHSPTLIAEQFWLMYQRREKIEVIY